MPDPAPIITDGHDNKNARTIASYENEVIKDSALAAMVGQIIANNRAPAGGARSRLAEMITDATTDTRPAHLPAAGRRWRSGA